MAWTINFDPRALKELEKLDRTAQKRIVMFFQKRVLRSDTPRDLGKSMTGDKVGLWRYRIGNFRAICQIKNETHSVLVLRVAHRKEVYR